MEGLGGAKAERRAGEKSILSHDSWGLEGGQSHRSDVVA